MTTQPADTPRCPFPHGTTHRKTGDLGHVANPEAPAIEWDGKVWHLRSYDAVRHVLRAADETRQGIFEGEQLLFPKGMRKPVAFQDGPPHKQQRTAIARFFTPKTVSESYQKLMDDLSDRLITELKQKGEADLSAISMELATQVAAQIVGLTNSRESGLSRRIGRMVAIKPEPKTRIGRTLAMIKDRALLLQFFLLDVRPAIIARRKSPKEDVISHLLSMGYTNLEILVECMTYSLAGMITTREFIGIAAWHFLENEAARQEYLGADEPERHRILHEILRLEPVVSHLYRRAVTDIELTHEGETHRIPAGAMMNLDIRATNADAKAVGADPLAMCPHRDLTKGVQAPVMSFGDGAHRCPGAYVAIQESDTFLQRLLQLPLVIEHPPRLDWDGRLESYEVRDFNVKVQGA